MYEAKGTHFLLDVLGVDSGLLNDMSYLNELLTTAIHKAGATILDIAEYKFDPEGCTLILLLSESHISVHSYPFIEELTEIDEEKPLSAAFLDIFTCGDTVNPQKAVDFIIEELKPIDFNIAKIKRGARE